MRALGTCALAAAGLVAVTAVASAAGGPRAVAGLNAQRALSGLPRVQHAPRMSKGCALHNKYMRLNGLGHGEKPGKPGYTKLGAREGDGSSTEVLGAGRFSFGTWTAAAGGPWENGPIHLYLLLHPRWTHAGADLSPPYVCMRLGGFRPEPREPAFFSYPGDGRKGVPPAQTAREAPYVPQQLVGIPAGRTTGPNLLLFSQGCYPAAGAKTALRSARLVGPGGPVPSKLVTEKHSGLLPGGGVLIPTRPLAPSSLYRATVTWACAAGEREQAFSFRTRGTSV